MTCKYYKSFDHVIEECLVLMENVQEKRNKQLTQNIQIMTTKRRGEKSRISIVTRSGATIESDKAYENKESESTWVRKTVEKVPFFDIQKEK